MNKILLTLILTFSTIATANTDYTSGVDYIKLDKPVKTETGDKVEVRELFWYYCPHCFDLEPLVENWLKTKPESAQFIRQPAVFSQKWVSGAIYYYLLEQLGEVDRLHGVLFDAIHIEKEAFYGSEDFVTWMVDRGVDKAKVEKAIKSFSLSIKLNKAKLNSAKYQIKGVPSFIVAGKYLVDSKHAGSNVRIFKVINHLIEKERK
ncbi:MAG: thiol:disulfide interchange protein DsbA/DsbL [Candidatus Thioglobus sp.]|nr:MAG: thiol:disulfide interchange protein DsbA/DsbL [Candidatus Thioglobus sp.]